MASGRLVEEVAVYLGADWLGYLSLEALTEAAAGGARGLCTACFTGAYPIPILTRLAQHGRDAPLAARGGAASISGGL